MIKIEQPFEGRQCNCCHKEDDVMEYDFRSDYNNSGICVALCRECRAKLREMLRNVDNIPSADAVEAVLCKDCYYYRPYDIFDGKQGRCYKSGRSFMACNGYCSMGVKKEERTHVEEFKSKD